MSFAIRCNDVLDELRQIPDHIYHGLFSDYPYGLANKDRSARGFLAQAWDQLPSVEVCRESLRVCRPGAYCLGFGHPRTYHRLASTLEEAGWLIVGVIIWVRPNGFPKSHDISKALDKMLGGVPTVVAHKKQKGAKFKQFQRHLDNGGYNDPNRNGYEIVQPDTPEARMWNDYGTGLRTAFEPIVVAMKPLEGTYAANAIKWGVAGLNLGACRIPCSDKPQFPSGTYTNPGLFGVGAVRAGDPNPESRWPANLILGDVDDFLGYETLFVRCPRALPWEKNAGLDGDQNDHPCVKPLALCRYLARLILPPAQDEPRRLLVPYAGTASEIIGAMLAGWDDVLGIERDTSYVTTAQERIRFWRRYGGDLPVPACPAGRAVENTPSGSSATSLAITTPERDTTPNATQPQEAEAVPAASGAMSLLIPEGQALRTFPVTHGDRKFLVLAATPKAAALHVAHQYLLDQGRWGRHYNGFIIVGKVSNAILFSTEALFKQLGYRWTPQRGRTVCQSDTLALS